MNEYGIMQGLNTGASGQMALAQSAAYQGNLANIGNQESQSLADNALALAQMKIQYEAAINQAQAQGNMQLANALYNEMVRQENVALQQQQLAQEQARWEAQFAYQQQQDALAQQNYLNELYAAQMAPSEPLLTYSQMMDALADGLVTPGVTSAYEYYMGVPYNGSVLNQTPVKTPSPAPAPVPAPGPISDISNLDTDAFTNDHGDKMVKVTSPGGATTYMTWASAMQSVQDGKLTATRNSDGTYTLSIP